MLADTHCHLYFEDFKSDLDLVLSRAWEVGIDRILVPGIDIPTSRYAIELAETHERIFAAVGVHPNNALTWKSDHLYALQSMCDHPKVVAIGEIGLDYYRDTTPPELQYLALNDQLDFATEVGLPVILHCRNAFDELRQSILDRTKHTPPNEGDRRVRGVFHSFEGSIDQAQAALQMNFFLGFSGSLTYPKSLVSREVIAHFPLNNLLLETDAPFLPPQQYRGRRNEPGFITDVLEKISQITDQSVEYISTISSQNADLLFNWGADR